VDRKVPIELPVGYVDFYKELESWQNGQEVFLKKEFQLEKLDIKKTISQSNKPLISQMDFIIKDELYKKTFTNLLEFLKKQRSDISETLTAISDLSDSFDYKKVIQDLLNDENNYISEVSEKNNVSEPLLYFAFEHALRPYLRVLAIPYREDMAKEIFNFWNFPNICPFCGSKSHFSRLRAEDSKRFMFCDRCFIEWEVRYLFCVHCANDEPGSIKFFSIENDESYQIYTCEKCKGYLKTYDEKTGGQEVDLFVANMETIYLDILAREHGYVNHSEDEEI